MCMKEVQKGREIQPVGFACSLLLLCLPVYSCCCCFLGGVGVGVSSLEKKMLVSLILFCNSFGVLSSSPSAVYS